VEFFFQLDMIFKHVSHYIILTKKMCNLQEIILSYAHADIYIRKSNSYSKFFLYLVFVSNCACPHLSWPLNAERVLLHIAWWQKCWLDVHSETNKTNVCVLFVLVCSPMADYHQWDMKHSRQMRPSHLRTGSCVPQGALTHSHRTHACLGQPSWIITVLFYWHLTSDYIYPQAPKPDRTQTHKATTVLIHGGAQSWHYLPYVLPGDRPLHELQHIKYTHKRTQAQVLFSCRHKANTLYHTVCAY